MKRKLICSHLREWFWGFLPNEITLDSGRFANFADDLLAALGAEGIRVYAAEDDRDIPLMAVAAIPSSDTNADATVDWFEETVTLPIVKYTMGWPTWDRVTSLAGTPDLGSRPVQRATQALVASWRHNLSARAVWFRPKSVRLLWEYRVTPRLTLRNWLGWLLTWNPQRLSGQRVTWYRAMAQVAAWDQVLWG